MPEYSIDALPQALQSVRTRLLFVLRLEVHKPQVIGQTPGPFRRIGVISGGTFKGDRLSGHILEGGSDWQTIRTDRATTLNVRIVLQTEDDALIGMKYRGIRHGSPEAMARIDRGEIVDPSTYYLRIAPLFQTAAPRYDWLNRVISVGLGHRDADGVVYSVFEVL